MIKSYNDLIGQALVATAKTTRATQLPDSSQIWRAITAAEKSADALAKGAPSRARFAFMEPERNCGGP
jgi:hypothetical protein